MKIVALLLALASPAAFAVTTTCEFAPEQLDSAVIVHVDREESRKIDIVTSELVIGGEEIAPMAPRCFYQDVPGRRGFRCAHKANEIRYDVYPKFTLPNDKNDTGKVKQLFLQVWENGTPKTFETKNCN